MDEFNNIITNDRSRNWLEDLKYNNGSYINQCYKCEAYFMGHKSRFVCKKCYNNNLIK